MKRSIQIFTMLLGVMFLISSCSEDFSPLEGNDEVLENMSHDLTHRNCGHAIYMESLQADPAKMKEHEEKIKRFTKYSETNVGERALCGSPTILPVAIHFQGVTNPDAACLTSLAETSIAALNQDYQGSNSDISTWNNQASSYFPGISNGETCIEFVIANQNHPSGFGLSNGDLAVTVNQTTGDNISQFSGYINIVIQPNTGLLGYSPLGGNGSGEALVIDAGAFGLGASCGNVGASAPFNLGRTLTHEMGHYLLLDHIWGNGCNSDDGVSDTPSQKEENYDCPSFGATSCSTNDMFMNYMDYVNDACMYMFSAGQSTVMENYVASNLNNVVSNASNVIGTSTGGGTGGGTDDDNNDDDNDDDGNGTGGGTTDTCESPEDGIAIDITTTSATITWTEVYDANRYIVRYKPVGGAWKSRVTTTNSRALTNLLPNTTYIFKLRVRCNSGGWQTYGATSTFQTAGTTGGGSGGSSTTVKMKLKLDYYGSETTFELVDESTGDAIKTGGPYQDGNSGQIINKTWNLEDGEYTFYIDDAYGDGICCDYGNGWAKILDSSNSVIAQSDGNFGYYDYLTFTVDNGDVFFKSEDKDQKSTNLIAKPMVAGN